MNKNWLPLGTTVLLKNGTQPIMIVGRYQQNNEGRIFDYSGVLNPQGFEGSLFQGFDLFQYLQGVH